MSYTFNVTRNSEPVKSANPKLQNLPDSLPSIITQLPNPVQTNSIELQDYFQSLKNSLPEFQTKAQGSVVPRDNYKKLPAFQFTVAIDTEYLTERVDSPTQMITTQAALSRNPEDCFVFEHSSLGSNRCPVWHGETIYSNILGWTEVTGPPTGYLIINEMLFFAPNDVLAGCFSSLVKCREIQRHLKQDARITIDMEKLGPYQKLLDLGIYLDTPHGILELVLHLSDYGKLGQGSLKEVVMGFGGLMEDKTLMDDYKTDMTVPYNSDDLELFQNYIKYGKEDSNILFFLKEANIERTKELYAVHDLEPPEYEILTPGRLVADLLKNFIKKEIGEHEFYKNFTVKDIKGRKKEWSLEDVMERSTVKYFAKKDETTDAVLALVQGGRAKNETPCVVAVDGVIGDVDLSGCYASIQQQMILPIGLPTVYMKHESTKKNLTLGKFLNKYGDSLLPRTWLVVVNGKLPFEQTLVTSKIIESIEISEKWDEDTCNIPADFRLYSKEIINGAITSDILEVLKNVCNASEYASFMNLEVSSAIWYPKNLRCETSEELNQKIKEHGTNEITKTLDKRTGAEITIDKRSRHWLPISLHKFLVPYIIKRKELKKEMKNHKKNSPEYNSLNARQNGMKLVVNVCFGAIASPYFDIGNVVTSNNITATARSAVWLTGQALGCNQTITDGGAYNMNAVRDWKNKKPSMNTLSYLRRRESLKKDVNYNQATKPLAADSDWSIVSSRVDGSDLYTTISNGTDTFEHNEGTWNELDEAALKHVSHYFRSETSPISLLDFMKYEHKDVYYQAIYHSQTNYQLTHATKVEKTKARGHKTKGTRYDDETSPANIMQLFKDLKNDPNSIPPYRPQTIGQILKCNQANEMLTSKTDNVYKQQGLVAGDTISKSSFLRPISISMFIWQNDAQFQSWKTQVDSLKRRTGYGLELFFLNPDGTLRYQEAIIKIQEAIDGGKSWLFPLTKGQPQEKMNPPPHPFFS